MPGMAAIVTILAPGASWTVAVTLSFAVKRLRSVYSQL